MVTQKIKELRSIEAQIQTLERSIEAERSKELAELPARYGYDTVQAFIGALMKRAKGSVKRPRRSAKAKPATPAAAAKKQRTRSKITDQTKAQVKKLVEEGKTGARIAKTVGISLPSVQNIKKELGLVKTRK